MFLIVGWFYKCKMEVLPRQRKIDKWNKAETNEEISGLYQLY